MMREMCMWCLWNRSWRWTIRGILRGGSTLRICWRINLFKRIWWILREEASFSLWTIPRALWERSTPSKEKIPLGCSRWRASPRISAQMYIRDWRDSWSTIGTIYCTGMTNNQVPWSGCCAGRTATYMPMKCTKW